MEPITYSLTTVGSSASTYYRDVARFTDVVLDRAQNLAWPHAEKFRRFVGAFGLEEVRTAEEYVFELLDLGVLWRRYGGIALAVRRVPYHTLGELAEWRKRHRRLKPAIDLARGIVATLLLLPKPRPDPPRVPSLDHVGRLLQWLESTGDLSEDAYRFVRWYAFWSSLTDAAVHQLLEDAVRFAEWFEEASAEALGTYTENVDRFLVREGRAYRWREDRIVCTKRRVEYHLSMVGAEILNRAFRRTFLATDRRAVLVPGCMRKRTEAECEAIRTDDGLVCGGCTASCGVNRIRQMGERSNFRVLIVPHASDLSRWSPQSGRPIEGVVGVACLATLLPGGWELKRCGVPAQCVVLNACGCPQHWRGDGTATEIDLRELKRIIEPV